MGSLAAAIQCLDIYPSNSIHLSMHLANPTIHFCSNGVLLQGMTPQSQVLQRPKTTSVPTPNRWTLQAQQLGRNRYFPWFLEGVLKQKHILYFFVLFFVTPLLFFCLISSFPFSKHRPFLQIGTLGSFEFFFKILLHGSAGNGPPTSMVQDVGSAITKNFVSWRD